MNHPKKNASYPEIGRSGLLKGGAMIREREIKLEKAREYADFLVRAVSGQ